MAQAVKQGWNINGIEIVPSLTQPFKRAYPTFAHQIHAGRFTDLHQNFTDESLDVISAIDVIEHLEDPFFELSQIYRILKKGGSFIAQTLDGACKKAQEGKEKWGGFKPYEHLFLFSALNLEMLAKRIGFQEVSFYQPFEMMDENFVAVFKK